MKNFILRKIEFPSEESLIESSTKWWNDVHENISPICWSNELKKYSHEFELIDIPIKLAKILVQDSRTQEDINKLTGYFDKKLSDSFVSQDDSFFAKLITRSAKDYSEDLRFKTSIDLLEAISCSMRTFEDLCYLIRIPKKCKLIIKRYINIDKSKEFRVFVKDSKLNGISQYHYNEKFDWVSKNASKINKSLRLFTIEKMIPNITTKDFVIDVLVDDKFQCLMIEINPYGLSDPCLFKSYKQLTDTFKFVNMEDKIEGIGEKL